MINVCIDDPGIPAGAGFTHESTSWQVSETKDFSGALFAEALNDPANLLEYKNLKTVKPDQVLFARAKVHFSNGTEADWTRTITLSSEQKGFKLSNTIIVTPEIFITNSFLDVTVDSIEVKTSDYALYAGTGEHKSTTWEITTLLGEEVWSRKKDEDNLTTYSIPGGKLLNNKTYLLKVSFHSDTNTVSNPGRLPFITGKANEGIN